MIGLRARKTDPSRKCRQYSLVHVDIQCVLALRTRFVRGLLFALCFAIALVACDRSSPPVDAIGKAASSPAARRVELPDGSTFELSAAPAHVIPANAAAAEFVAPLLGPERIAALPEQVDAFSSFPFREHGFEKLPRFTRYAAEPLIVLRPDLVVTHAWQAAETTQTLRAQGVPVLVLASAQSYDDIRRTLALLGRLFDREAESAHIVDDLDRRVARLAASAHERETLRAIVYSNDGTGGWTAGRHTTVDTLIRLAGLRNAAAEAGIQGHVALDFERLIALDPDVIVVSAPAQGEGGSATATVLQSAKELASLTAVARQRIVVLPSSLISADSQLLVDGAERLAVVVDRLIDIHAGEKH